jgi:MFS family permease
MGLYWLFGDVGFVVGPIILGVIADGYGLRTPFYFMSGLIIVNAALLGVFAKETYRVKRVRAVT